MGWILRDKETKNHVENGDTVQDRYGDTFTIMGFRPPHKPSSSGFVWVEGLRPDDSWGTQEFYPFVFGLEIVETVGD